MNKEEKNMDKEEEKIITIKIKTDAGDTIEKLTQIKELLLEIKGLTKEVLR